MNINELKELLLTIEGTSLEYIKLERNDFKLEVSKNNICRSTIKEEKSQQLSDNYIIDSDIVQLNSDVPDYSYVVAPLMGTFYSAPNPNEECFVKVGDVIKQGDTLCILEAMKLMNEITSEVNGEVMEILVQNEELVEYSQPLIKIRPL